MAMNCFVSLAISLKSTKDVVVTGESVSFYCSINGLNFNKPVTFTMPNGTIVNSSSNSSSQGNVIVYKISSVQPSHAGQYKCHTGNYTARKELFLKCK